MLQTDQWPEEILAVLLSVPVQIITLSLFVPSRLRQYKGKEGRGSPGPQKPHEGHNLFVGPPLPFHCVLSVPTPQGTEIVKILSLPSPGEIIHTTVWFCN